MIVGLMRNAKGSAVGVAISQHQLDLCLLDRQGHQQFIPIPLNDPVLDATGSQITDPERLLGALREVASQLPMGQRSIHLSVPTSVLRLMDIPSMQDHELFLALSSEAERYKVFDGSEAHVIYKRLDPVATANNAKQERVIFSALRHDTLEQYKLLCRKAGLKLRSIGFHTLNTLRAMAATGVLDALHQQIGAEGLWGVLSGNAAGCRIMLWQGNQLKGLRETAINVHDITNEQQLNVVVQDLCEDIRRTTQLTNGEFPQVWLTWNLSPGLGEQLTHRFQTPFQPFTVVVPNETGQPAIQVVRSPAEGACYWDQTVFPFRLDALRARSQISRKDVERSMQLLAESESHQALPFNPLLVNGAAAVLVLLLWLGGLVYQGQLDQQLTAQQQEKSRLTASVNQLSSQYQQIKAAYEVKASLYQVADSAQQHNAMAVALAKDLVRVTPSSLWLHSIVLDNGVTFEGKALNHTAVIQFARSFDQVPYMQGVTLDFLKEGFVGTNPVYDFKVRSDVAPSQLLMSDQSSAVPPRS